jgi:tight adherence protein C
VLIIIGLKEPHDSDALQDRLAEFAARGEKVSLEEIELSQPISQRVVLPLARKMGEFALRYTPQNALQSTAHKIELAGSPRGMDPTILWGLRFLIAISIGVLFLFLFRISDLNWTWGRKILITAVFVGLGFMLPELLINSMIQRRQKSIRKALPDALDLLTICVEAGLGFDGAMNKVYEKWDNPLSLAFGRVLREIQLGKLRREGLRDMADRIGLAEMTSFVAAVIQSEQLGVSMAKVLRIQADQMRIRRRQKAEEEAHKAPIKMLVPMAVLIFPSICIVLMTPAILQLMRSQLNSIFFGGG